MKSSRLIIATAILAACSSQVLARGGQGGPIGPGSRDGLTPGVNDSKPAPYTIKKAPSPAVKARTRRAQ